MWSDDIEIRLRYDAHAEVVVGASEEAGESGRESHTTIPTRDANTNLQKLKDL